MNLDNLISKRASKYLALTIKWLIFVLVTVLLATNFEEVICK